MKNLPVHEREGSMRYTRYYEEKKDIHARHVCKSCYYQWLTKLPWLSYKCPRCNSQKIQFKPSLRMRWRRYRQFLPHPETLRGAKIMMTCLIWNAAHPFFSCSTCDHEDECPRGNQLLWKIGIYLSYKLKKRGPAPGKAPTFWELFRPGRRICDLCGR